MKKILAGLAILVVVVGGGLALLPTLAPEFVLETLLSMERGRGNLVEKKVQVDDHEVVYLEGGNPDGPPVLLIHGFAADKDNWTRFAPHLADDYRLIVPDLPGFGWSTRDDEASYDIGSQVERVNRFLDEIGLEHVHVAGNSMGGHLAAAWSIEYPDRARSTFLLANAGIDSPIKSEIHALREQGHTPLLVDSPEDFDRLLGFVFVEKPWIPHAFKKVLAERAVEFRDFNDKILADQAAAPWPLEPRLAQLQAPVLILWGDTDRLLHVSSIEPMKPLIPNIVDVVILKDCGHSPMIERPRESADHYRRFLAGLEPG